MIYGIYMVLYIEPRLSTKVLEMAFLYILCESVVVKTLFKPLSPFSLIYEDFSCLSGTISLHFF